MLLKLLVMTATGGLGVPAPGGTEGVPRRGTTRLDNRLRPTAARDRERCRPARRPPRSPPPDRGRIRKEGLWCQHSRGRVSEFGRRSRGHGSEFGLRRLRRLAKLGQRRRGRGTRLRFLACALAFVSALTLAGLALSAAPAAAAAALDVVVTLKPLHSLIERVMEGTGHPHLLLNGNESPHTHALRISEVRRLARADIIFWISPAFERFLVKPLETLGGETRTVELAATPGLSLWPTRGRGVWAERPAPADATIDPHLWLDPLNGARMAAYAADQLAAADPDNAALYRINARALAADLAALDRALDSTLRGVRAAPYAVLNDAYQYLERRYRLNTRGALLDDAHQPPGARSVSQMIALVRSEGVGCIAGETAAPPVIDMVLGETGGTYVWLDPLGVDLPPGPELYPELLLKLADALRDCLSTSQ